MWVKSLCMSAFTYRSICASVCMCVCVCVFTARIRVRGPVSLHLTQAELLICTSLSARLTNATRQLGALCAGKRRDHLASLSGFRENVTFHQAAIYRLLQLLLQTEKDFQLAGGGQQGEETAGALTCLNEKTTQVDKNLKVGRQGHRS